MAPPEGRGADFWVYLISCVLFLATVCGGVFLALYIAFPASDATAWFPVAGMALVGTPWAFWTATCLYRALTMRRAARGGGAERPPVRRAPAGRGAAAAIGAQEGAAVDSPGDARRVRFGGATVLGGTQEAPPGVARPEDEGGAAAADGSSHTSHESELPLFVAS